MKTSMLKLVTAASLSVGLLAPVHATVLTFEGVGSVNLNSIAYGGFHWSNALSALGTDFASFPGIPQSVVSGSYSAINSDLGADSFGANTAFAFISAYFTAYDVRDGQDYPLTISGYLNGNLVGTQTATITNTGPTFVALNQAIFGNVTEVSFSNYNGDFRTGHALAFDDLTVSALDAVDVPEPASLALLGLGMLGLAAARRRQRKD